ncbi:MAG: TIGR00730 family Rossman fold protein [Rhodothermales bacterium]|nr:TIGR00730 family Rossman fold protein [Rhodothermales bacterium]MBO6780723.1 TIGR00730 family Rossman fold protein [Rhodothermales bacterium]
MDPRKRSQFLRSMSPTEIDTWHETRIRDLWRVFRIMGEFVDGFEKLSEVGPCVSIFGSARTKPDHPEYQQAVDLAKELVRRGFGVITGGGPGIMEAGNKGANEAGGVSVGLNIVIPHEQSGNIYVDSDKSIDFDFFFVRKVMFVKYAMGFIVMPGGFGTLDELFEALTLIQTQKSTRFPVVLVGSSYWGGLVDWLHETMLADGKISPGDPDLFHVTDSVSEAVDIVERFYREHSMVPNF